MFDVVGGISLGTLTTSLKQCATAQCVYPASVIVATGRGPCNMLE